MRWRLMVMVAALGCQPPPVVAPVEDAGALPSLELLAGTVDLGTAALSDFGRTFPKSGSDHHPATCAILVGGSILGNQMVGGYDESMNGSPMGAPVRIIEESGAPMTRTPRSQDVAATVLHAFGLEGGRDYFIPGGYGHFDGVVG